MPGPTAARNATLRQALARTWPTVPFTVRTRRGAVPEVTWTDGPSPDQVHHATVTTLTGDAPDTAPPPHVLARTVTAQTVAIAFLRAHIAGQTTPHAPGHAAQWADVDSFDATTITPADRAAGALLLAVAVNHPGWDTDRAAALTHAAGELADILDTIVT